MRAPPACLRAIIVSTILLPTRLLAADGVGAPVSYNYEVRPLLANRCFACHGADAAKRKGDLRLDNRDAAIAAEAIVPGKPDQSGLIERIHSEDPGEIMPPPAKHQPLNPDEKALLARWISQGAPYESHWAFQTPVKPNIPADGTGTHPIDSLVRRKLTAMGWQPAPAAGKEEWLRRVTLALTGLPPGPEELAAFLADPAPDADARVVDRLLASPRFGEHLAVAWLDAARFGDTYGRHEDADSPVWPWRDWVIKSFNANLPYDKFIQWQMAGDMLPAPSQDQLVATAFHRLPVQSNESGSDPEEFRWEQVFDRVKTTSTAVMGLTMECARCHDHKYDPFTSRDYFRFAAFFDNIDELGLFSRYSNGIPAPTTFVYKDGEAERHARLKAAVADAESRLAAERANARARFSRWLEQNDPPECGDGLWNRLSRGVSFAKAEALPAKPDLHLSFDYIEPKSRSYKVDTDAGVMSTTAASGGSKTKGKFGDACMFPKKISFPKVARYLRWQPFSFSFWLQCPHPPEKGVILHRSRAGLDAANRGYEITFESGKLTATLGHFYPGNALRIQLRDQRDFSDWHHVAFTYDGSSRAAGMKIYIDGKPQEVDVIRDSLYKDIDYLQVWGDLDNSKVADADNGDRIILTLGGRTLDSGMREGGVDELRAFNVALCAAEVLQLAGNPTTDRQAWFDWYTREIDDPCRAAWKSLMSARQEENDFTIPLTELMIMKEKAGPRRPTPILARGDFRQPTDLVEPGVPAVLPPGMPPATANRVGLADWLTNPRHPLTSRVEVNRLWAMFFGRGIVATPEDFGLQGSIPSHPELLDWLAVHFVESGWDIKSLCREIALSATYRQSSLPVDRAYAAADPANQWLSRGPSFRLSGEQLRDVALATSGLLCHTIGGPSVKPYQPVGLWEESGTQHVYEQDKGVALHRRSLYTFWRRTCPPPALSVFDAPTREFCRVRREKSMTPLQSLALMNDTGFLEAARVLAENLVRIDPEPANQSRRVTGAFRLLTSRQPSAVEAAAMAAMITEARAYYGANPAEAVKLISATGEAAVDTALDQVEVAATLLMARALYNSESFVCSH